MGVGPGDPGQTPSRFSRKAWRGWALRPGRRLRTGSEQRPWACPGKSSACLRWASTQSGVVPAESRQPLPTLVTPLKSVGLGVMAPKKPLP